MSAMLEAVPCPDCRLPGTVAGSTASSTIYRCPRAHTWKVAKVQARVRMKVGDVGMEASGSPKAVAAAVDMFNDLITERATPPDTSRDRPSYKNPKPFGPDSLPAKILAYLREPPHRIDHHVAERLWNHSRLAGSIHILRTHGFLFETHLNEGTVAVYELLNPNHQPKC